MDIYASDEEKAEEIKRWWRENGRSVLTGVLIGVALIIAVRYWMNFQQNQVEQSAIVYQQVLMQVTDGKLDEASTATEKLMSDYPSSAYAVFAALQMASESKDETQAEKYLQWVKQNASLDSQKNLATLRLARLLYGKAEYEQALKLINEDNSKAYASLFAELAGDIYKQQGEKQAALTAYERALTEAGAGSSRQSLLKIKIDDVAVQNES